MVLLRWIANGLLCIYQAMMTDTGGIVYNSNEPVIYLIISELLTKNIDKDKIYRKVFNNYSTNSIRFRGHIMDKKLRVFENLHASYYWVVHFARRWSNIIS